MSCPIDCSNVHYNEDGTIKREWSIDVEGRVWPCNIYANLWGDTRIDIVEHEKINADVTFKKMFKDDPTWNDLKYHTLKEIVNNEVFWTKLWFPGWNNNDTTNICLECARTDTPLYKKVQD